MFRDRHDAGKRLAAGLQRFYRHPGCIVLALPRGGVPVAFEVALALELPWDVFVVRKLGVPGQEELGMGAIASGGVRVLNPVVVRALRISDAQIEAVTAREKRELERREREYRGSRPPLSAEGRLAILIDDGLATGSTMRAAIGALQQQKAGGIVVAVPVAACQTRAELERLVDDLVCLSTPEPFEAVGEWYQNFSQVSDAEVRQLLGQGNQSGPPNVIQVLQ